MAGGLPKGLLKKAEKSKKRQKNFRQSAQPNQDGPQSVSNQSDNFSTLGATANPGLANSLAQKDIEMVDIYKLVDFEEKGLGCVASTDIKRGSLILNENPQIQSSGGLNHRIINNYYRVPGEILDEARQNGHLAEWIESLLKSFNQMNRQRFVPCIGNIEKAILVFNCLSRPCRFWFY